MEAKETQSKPRGEDSLTQRFGTTEAAVILRMSRAQLYKRIKSGALHPQKDEARTYITRAELERYVRACGPSPPLNSDIGGGHRRYVAESLGNSCSN